VRIHNAYITCITFMTGLVLLLIPRVALAQQSHPIKVHRTVTVMDSAGNPVTVEIPDTTTESTTLSFDTVKVNHNWPKLQMGLSMSDVKTLLGSPPKVRFDQTYEYWWYGDHAIIFNVVTHKVSGWDK
jgi:hypothetical protein